MSHWNHRLIRRGGPGEDPWYRIHEVYYDDSGKISGWTIDPVEPFGETVEEIRQELEAMLRACGEPVLRLADDGALEPV